MVTELLSDLGCLNHLLISQGIFMLNNKSTNQRNQLSIPFRFSTFYHASFAPVKLCSSSESGKKRSAESSKKPRAFLFQSLRRGFVKFLLKLYKTKQFLNIQTVILYSTEVSLKKISFTSLNVSKHHTFFSGWSDLTGTSMRSFLAQSISVHIDIWGEGKH